MVSFLFTFLKQATKTRLMLKLLKAKTPVLLSAAGHREISPLVLFVPLSSDEEYVKVTQLEVQKENPKWPIN